MKRIAAGILLFVATMCTAQVHKSNRPAPPSRAEAFVNCTTLFFSGEQGPVEYGFAKETLTSLWYANAAAGRADEISQVAKEDTFSFFTTAMRVAKMSTDDFICAKRAVEPFVSNKKAPDYIQTAAKLLMLAYDGHIHLNEQVLDFIRKAGNLTPTEMMDRLSTMEVERGQRWADLVQPTALALMLLVDSNRSDENGKATWLNISKAQKQELLGALDEHFPELKDNTPREKRSAPANAAELYRTALQGRKGSDEVPDRKAQTP